MQIDNRVSTPPGKCDFFLKLSGTWKIRENEFGSRKSLKLNFKVLECPGIYQCFNLSFVYRTPCVNKCMKYSCYVLTKQFLCNL